jgi:hypothetical protein
MADYLGDCVPWEAVKPVQSGLNKALPILLSCAGQNLLDNQFRAGMHLGSCGRQRSLSYLVIAVVAAQTVQGVRFLSFPNLQLQHVDISFAMPSFGHSFGT